MNDPAGGNRKPGMAAADGTSHALAATLPSPKRVSSADLMGGEREILIDHSGEIYRLRRTGQGKLILTK